MLDFTPEPKYLLILAIAALAVSCSPSVSDNPTPAAQGGIPVNPQKATPGSIASGKRVYERHCVTCHGVRGDGKGTAESDMAQTTNGAKPSDLTDDQWDYGASDGEIFLNIRNGLGPNSGMTGINGKAGIYPEEIWDTVNYVRRLHRGGAPAPPAGRQ